MIVTALLLTVLKLTNVLDCSWMMMSGIVIVDKFVRFLVGSR